jgi:hypothetical protein
MQKLMILYSPTMYCTSYYCMSLNACFCNIRVPDAERERKEGGEVKRGQANIGSHGSMGEWADPPQWRQDP